VRSIPNAVRSAIFGLACRARALLPKASAQKGSRKASCNSLKTGSRKRLPGLVQNLWVVGRRQCLGEGLLPPGACRSPPPSFRDQLGPQEIITYDMAISRTLSEPWWGRMRTIQK